MHRMQISEYNHRRKQAKDVVRNKRKRTRTRQQELTVEETERMTEFLMRYTEVFK